MSFGGISFAGYGAVDTTAPVLSSATGTQTGSTTADLAVTTDTASGTMWWVVVAAAASTPSATQVRAGTDGGGTAAVATNATGGTSVSTTSFTASATGLTASTSYKVYFTQDDLSANHSTVAGSSSFTTASGSFDADTTTWANQVVTNGGTVGTTSKTAVDALIKSIKADGNLGPNLNSVLDRLWVIANIDNDSIQSMTSIVNPGTAATTTGSITKTANGWTGSSAFIDTLFNPNTAGGHYTLNSATVGAYGNTSRTVGDNSTSIAAFDGSNFVEILQFNVNASQAINMASGFIMTNAGGNANGLKILTRTGASTVNLYDYNGAGAPVTTSNSTASSALPNRNIYILARNNAGTADSFTTDQISVAFIGGGLSLTAANSLAGYIKTYLNAIPISPAVVY